MKYYAWALICTSLAIAAFCVVLGSPGAKAWQSGDTCPATGDWTINNPTIVAEEASLTVNGSIIINAKLEIYNSYLTVNSSSDNQRMVNVTSTGTLQMYGSQLTAYNTAYHYSFQVWGNLDINQSSVAEMWGDTSGASWAGGIQIYKSGAQVRNSSIFNGRTGGIYINNCSATVTGCNIYNNGNHGMSSTYTYGIFMTGDGMGTATSNRIDGNMVYTNTYSSGITRYGTGIYSQFQGSGDRITNNRIYDNGHVMSSGSQGTQLRLQYSNATVTDNFLGNGSYQMYVYGSSPPAMKNMNFSAHAYSSYTTYGVYAYNSTLTFDTCTWYSFWGMGTEYGVYSTGPTFNSSAFLTFKKCDFNITQAGTYARYAIYTQYTTIDISSTNIAMMYGTISYGIYSMASSTFGTYLNITNSAVSLVSSTSTTYIMYASYSYVNISGSSLAASRTSSTTYGIYVTASSTYAGSLNVTGTRLNISSTMSTTYGLYTSYTPLNMSRSVMDLWDIGMNGGTIYMMYSRYYSNMTIDNCTFNETFLAPSLYFPSSPSRYGIYNMYYTVLRMDRCFFNYSSAANGQYPYSASYYMFYPSQNSPGFFGNCTLNMTVYTGYYNYYTYMFYPQSYSSQNFTDSTVIFSANNSSPSYYSYYHYVFNTNSYCDISFLNSKLWVNNCTSLYLYAVYTSYGGISFENSTYLASDNRVMYTTYYMMMYGYGSGKLFMNNSKYLIVNDRDWNQYNYKYTYCAYAYDMPTTVTNSTINWELLSQGPYVAPPSVASIYYYGFYSYSYSSWRDYLIVNNTFRITHGVNASGGWLFMPQYMLNVRFSNNYINYTHSSNGGSVWYGSGSGRTPYYIDNCTVEYMTKSTQPMRGGIMFNQMSYIDLYVNDTKIFMRNDGGFYPFNMFYYLSYAKAYFYNCSLEYNIGGGDGRWGQGNDASPCGYMQYTDTLKFTNSVYTITTRTEPVLLRSFNYTSGQSGSLIFDNSKMIWNIQSPNTVASFLYFYSQSGGAPGLSLLECKNAQLDMKISGTDSASQMISMAPGAGLASLKIDKTALSLTVSAVSVKPSTIIYMDGQKGNTLANLLMTVNGPSPAVDPNGVTTITGVQLVKSFPTIDNFTVNCNGQGRVYGIICDVVSIPMITNTKVNNAYAGVWSRFFSQPAFSGCEFRDCKYGVMADTTSNVTMTGCSIINSTIGANVTDRSWLSITECTFTNVAQFPISLSESTAWSLSSKFDKDKVKFNDQNSTLIINWLLQVKVTWQNGVVIEGARVTATDTQGGLAVSASSDEKGIVPWFFVTEYIQTNYIVKTFHSPYTVNATIAGLTGSSVVTTDETKEAPVVITDPFDPVVAITAPEDNTYQNFTRVSLVGTATDLGSGIDHLSFSHNGVDWVDVPATKVWELEMVVPEGTWTIQARLYDIAGRMSSAAITLTVDLTSPFITVTDPRDSSLGNRIGVDLVGSVEKGSLFTVNHRPVSVGADGSFRYGLRLVEGKNVFALFARDLAGNTNATTWTLYLDITPPPLALTGPADGLLTNQKSVAVSGKTEPGAGLKVNDAAAEVKPDGSFSLVFNLNRGPNSILVVASDLAGNTASALRTVVMDDELALGVAFPEDNLVTNQITILVRGTTDTDALLRLNDGLMTVGPDGNFSVTYTLAEGPNELVFRATDRAGNSASLTRKVVLDTQSPVLEVGTPADGSILRTKEVTVTGICEPGMVLTINGEAVSTESGTFSKTLSLPEGTGAISLEGRDQAGNPVSRRLTVLVDITEPSLNIVEPQTGFRTRDLTVMVVGITEPGATVTVNGAAVVVDPFGKFSTGVTLVKGSNTIKVTATDEAGNQKAESVTVKNTVPPAAPASQTWLWSVAGVVLALCIMVPISMLLVNNALREKGRKEGSQ